MNRRQAVTDLPFSGGLRRRSAIGAFAGIACSLALPALARGFPDRAIKIVVPFSSGGTTDGAARLLAEMLTERTGTPFIIDNKPGAGAAIGIDHVARSAADGYTLLYGSDTLILGPLTRPNLGFSLSDFIALVRVRTASPYLSVSPSLGVGNVKELVALAKSKPGVLRYGSGGVATVLHIAGAQFTIYTNTDILHIPYKGASLAINDLLGGHIDMTWTGAVDCKPHQESGALKVIAMTGERRSLAMPGVPTMAEAGFPDLLVQNWNGMLAPKSTPPDVVKWLSDNIAAVAASPEFLKRGAPLEIEPGAMQKGKAFAMFLEDTRERYSKVIKQANIKLNE
jgi:tripartite-type tricarboxylate transporter receptor subunit TctC